MTNKRANRKNGSSDLTEAEWAWLNDCLTNDIGSDWERYDLDADQSIGGRKSNKQLWNDYRSHVLTRWVVEMPGTRPSLWWRYDAPRRPTGEFADCFWDGVLPVARERVGGVGTPLHEVLAYVPHFYLGVPVLWAYPDDPTYSSFDSVTAINLSDPPIFESQASWLRRLGLFERGEEARLSPADFHPQSVTAVLASKRPLAGDAANG